MTPAIAVQKLGLWQRDAIMRHLRRLPDNDRRLRFGRPMRDDAIGRYVDAIDFARDRVLGIHVSSMELGAVGHLALDGAGDHAELGLSVDEGLRGRGCGEALLRRAVLHAANRGYRALYMHCLSENQVMLRLAARAGLQTVIAAGEADARLALDRGTHGGAWREAMEDQFALVDYILKQQGSMIGRRAAPPQAPGRLFVDEMAAG